jgi:cytidylate kinase
MSVITISRQLGGLGTEIAQEVAAALNYAYADKEMIGKNMAGSGIPMPEVEKFDEKKPPFWDSLNLQRRKFLLAIQAEIYDLAGKGDVVIVGRGGQVLLKDLPGVLHVRVFAPFQVRAQRLLKRGKMDDKQAVRLLRQSDEDSSGYIRSFFNADWEDPNLYDLLVNTEKLSVETGVRAIIEAARFTSLQTGNEKVAARLADLALAQRAGVKLMEAIGSEANYLEIKAEKGILTLKGAVTTAAKSQQCEKAAAGLPGVERVANELSVYPIRFGP